MMKLFAFICGIAFALAFSWAVCISIMWLIALCFSVGFSLRIATGIWLVLGLIRLTEGAIKTNKSE